MGLAPVQGVVALVARGPGGTDPRGPPSLCLECRVATLLAARVPSAARGSQVARLPAQAALC
eukprot:997154-Lingulodinium_polyedra.AAC.1